MSTLFAEQTLVFDSNTLDTNKVPLLNYDLTDHQFGILSLKATEGNISKKELELIFQIDCSGSMSDQCADGRTKMQHILHTLKNMILFFKENTELKVNVTIRAFDDKIYKIIDRTIVNNDTYEKIIAEINLITPKGATNIENALKQTALIASELKKEHPESDLYHILMTDGRPTAGYGSYEYLKGLVDDSYTNVFIGFGIDHDATLLNELGETNEKSANYFIDQLENAGLVYGEILHGFVYKLLENTVITVNNGLVYDFKTNTWNSTLRIGDIVSESIKFYHIVSNTPEFCSIELTGNKAEDQTNIYIEVQPSLNSNVYIDLTKYVYRQRTQQILYKINEFLKKTNRESNHITFMRLPNLDEEKPDYTAEKHELKEELTTFFGELKQYIEENQLQTDILLKNLCDDIYICHRTFGTKYAEMYCGARMCSQGNQRTYTATQVPDDEPYPVLKRSYAVHDEDGDGDGDEDDIGFIPPPILLRHEVSDSLATPYRTASNIRVMREVSGTQN